MDNFGRPTFTSEPGHPATHDEPQYEHEQIFQQFMESDEGPISPQHGFDRECLLGDLQRLLNFKHVVHSVFGLGRHPDSDDRSNTIKTLHQSSRSPKPFIAIADHIEETSGRSHLHVVHACPFSNRSCRCRFLGDYSRGAFKCVRRGDVTTTYLRNLMHYVNSWPRQLRYVYIPGDTREILSSDEDLQICGCINCAAGETLDEGFTGHEICRERPARGSNFETYHGINNRHSSLQSGSSQGRSIYKEEEVYQLVKDLCITPINNTVLSIHWLKSPFKFLPRGSPILQTIFNTWSRELKHMTVSDLNTIYTNTKPYFSCTSADISDFYYSLDETITRCNTLLEFQFPDIDIRIEFLQQLLLVITKLNEKKTPFALRDLQAVVKRISSALYLLISFRLDKSEISTEMTRSL